MSDRPLAVIDLDGVVADVRHRLHHVEGHPRNWAAFFAGIPHDPALEEGVALVRELATRCDVVYLTGRPERTRPETLAWLARHDLPQGRLVMRREQDRRPARIAKLGLLARIAAGRAVETVVDDDPAVCAALAAAGWPVLQADFVERARALDAAQERLGRT